MAVKQMYGDNDMLLMIKNSNAKGLELLFKTYHHKLWLFANQFLNDADAAEDIVQDLFTYIWEKRVSLQINSSLKAYLYMSVKNRCLNKLKTEMRTTTLVDDADESFNLTHQHTQQIIEAKNLQQRIDLAIAALPPKCGLAFKMSRFEDMSYKEIAEALDISVKTVENQIGKALSIMRLQLKDFLVSVVFACMLSF